VLQPAYGPSLPVLLRDRAGVPPRVTIAAVVALVVLFGIAMAIVRPGAEDGEQWIHEGNPVFNVLYEPDALRVVEPRPGELLRLEGSRGRQSVAVTVRPLSLPPYRGDISHGLLPVFAVQHIEALKARYDRFLLMGEGRARVNDAPGYEVVFRSGPPSARTFGSDVLLVTAENDARDAVILSLRREKSGRGPLGERGHEFSNLARKAFRSFRYGRDRG
jgi:hypothetical protein